MSKKARKPKKKLKGKENDEVYLPSLDALVDKLYQEAFDQKLDWNQLAIRSGLSDTTIRKLAMKETRYPMFRTIQLIAFAVGGHVSFTQGKKSKVFKITWTPAAFANRRKAA